MTTEQAIALGCRMMACKGFEPRRGMFGWSYPPEQLAMIIERFGAGARAAAEPRCLFGANRAFDEASRFTPDPRDPGTMGHALAMMREAVGDSPPACVIGQWRPAVIGLPHRVVWDCCGLEAPTEAEALINAWEALS